jgi:hypothetical protein
MKTLSAAEIFENALLAQRVANRYAVTVTVEMSDEDYQKSDAYKISKSKDYYPQKAPSGMKLPSIPSEFKSLAEGMPDIDMGHEAYNHPAVKKLSTKLLSDLKSGKVEASDMAKEGDKAHKLMLDFMGKATDAETDEHGDPFRFAGRKMFQVWRAYNFALQTANQRAVHIHD